ncbi:hypothetical protein CR513_58099, partial [Mucuna pruriens]
MGEDEPLYNAPRDTQGEGVIPPHEAVLDDAQARNTTSTGTPASSPTPTAAIERACRYRFEVAGLCLIPDVFILHKFKVPDFNKYKGNSCPKNHLISYCRKMVAQTQDDKLLIRSWGDLAKAFLKQYRYNEELAPDQTQFQRMVKKDTETFKEYAQ